MITALGDSCYERYLIKKTQAQVIMGPLGFFCLCFHSPLLLQAAGLEVKGHEPLCCTWGSQCHWPGPLQISLARGCSISPGCLKEGVALLCDRHCSGPGWWARAGGRQAWCRWLHAGMVPSPNTASILPACSVPRCPRINCCPRRNNSKQEGSTVPARSLFPP